jgi:hypothetical protein
LTSGIQGLQNYRRFGTLPKKRNFFVDWKLTEIILFTEMIRSLLITISVYKNNNGAYKKSFGMGILSAY